MIKSHFSIAIHFNLSSFQDQAELPISIRLEMALENIWKGPEICMKIINFSVNWSSSQSMAMESSFQIGNFYQSNNKTSSNLLHKNTLESIPGATVER